MCGVDWIADPNERVAEPVRAIAIAPDPSHALSIMEVASGEPIESMGNVGAVPSGALGVLTRATPRFRLPPGFAFELPSGDVALEVTAEPTGAPRTISPRVRFILAAEKATRAVTAIGLMPSGLDLAPEACETRTLEHTLTEPAAFVGAVVRGGAFLRAARVNAMTPDGAAHQLVAITDLLMSLNEPVVLAHPIEFPAGTVISVQFEFDNTSQNPQQPFRPLRHIQTGLPPECEDGNAVLWLAPKSLTRASPHND